MSKIDEELLSWERDHYKRLRGEVDVSVESEIEFNKSTDDVKFYLDYRYTVVFLNLEE